MGTNLAQTICDISYNHVVHNNGIIIGQTLSAVGRVNNTVPELDIGIVEIPMTDTAGAGLAVGAALVGRRPIFIIRFQDFCLLNSSSLVYYAAKSKDMQDKECPVFIRSISSEKLGVGHSGCSHSLFMHYPGFQVYSPMTPQEYKYVWNEFMKNNDPFFVSEHKNSFNNCCEMPDVITPNADITIYSISAIRFEMEKLQTMLMSDGIRANIVHVVKLKPFNIDDKIMLPLTSSKKGIVIDIDFEIAGASKSIAYDLSIASGYPVYAMGLKDKSKMLSYPFDNEIPDAITIFKYIKMIL